MENNLEGRIAKIEDRNVKVEQDKAWEKSFTRRFLLMVFTYLSVGFYFKYLGIDGPWINAIVPAVAFMISTLSMPIFKKMWLEKNK